jgi:3-hydroxy-9,10-secoandrosta-1,3,5(10)-triene-9,17-dione monooxygenase reductase component
MVEDGVRRYGDDPFLTPPPHRDEVRRFRGRLAAPVTIWTTCDAQGDPIGLTVSAIVVVSGSVPYVAGLLDAGSDFYEAVEAHRRFVVHVVPASERRLADEFAGRYPGKSPFSGRDVVSSNWGPVLSTVATRACCALDDSVPCGEMTLVRGLVEETTLPDETAPPLVHYQGKYYTIGPRNLES